MVFLFAIPGVCIAFDVTAHVDKFKISQEDSVFLTVEVNGGKAELDLSVIKDFKVISRGTSSSFNYINGKSEKKASYQYVLLPLSKGRLQIPAIKAIRKGQTAFTEQIIIDVADKIVSPDEVKALFAKSIVTKNQLFTGEQAVFSLQFFTSRRLSGIGFEKQPEFKGFSVKPFEEEKSYTQNINGVRFNVTQVDYIITPSNPGRFTIEPAILIAKVVVKSNFNDSFFFSDRSKPVRVVSNPVEINVVPLPQYQGANQNLQNQGNLNQPHAKFSGLVGSFDIKSQIDKTNLKAGESATLTITISGTGNIMDASLPEMNSNNGAFKIYDDNPVETIKLTRKGYQGYKIFKKAIVPVNPGVFEIKPFTLIYFDIDKKDFQSVSTASISLDVVPSETIHLAAQPQNLKTDKIIIKKEVALVHKDIFEIKEGLEVLKNYKEINFLFFILFLSIPAILFFGVKFFTIVLKKEISIEKQMQSKAKFHLKKAMKLHKEDKDFLSHLNSSLVASVLARGHKKGENITIQEVKTILNDADIDIEKAEQVTKLFEKIESIRFGGKILDENMAKDILSKTKQIIKTICIVMACFGMFAIVPQKAVADSTAVFIDAIKDYKAGNFKEAGRKFEKITQSNIKNPYLYYNIGNSYLKAGDIGYAVLWYERAKKIMPNDPDLNFNLDHANTLVKDKREDSINIMEVLFFWDNLVSAKMIQIASVLSSFAFFTWAAIQLIRRKKIFSGFGIMVLSIFILFTSVVFVNYYKQAVKLNAVIVTKEAVIRSGMADTATQLFTLHAGTKIRVIEQKKGYLKIKFSKDKIGWVSTSQAVII